MESKLNNLSERSYSSYPKIIEGRTWTVLNALFNDVKIEISCSKIYKNNMVVKDWFRRGVITAYRLGLIEDDNNIITMTQLGQSVLEHKKLNKLKTLNLKEWIEQTTTI